jgi:hypothetical protein
LKFYQTKQKSEVFEKDLYLKREKKNSIQDRMERKVKISKDLGLDG